MAQVKVAISQVLCACFFDKYANGKRTAQKCSEDSGMSSQEVCSQALDTNQKILAVMGFQVPPLKQAELGMNSTYSHLESSPRVLSFAFQFPLVGNYQWALFFSKPFGQELGFNLGQGANTQNGEESAWKHRYESQPKKNIVLNQTKPKKSETPKSPKLVFSDQQTTTKSQKKCRQKQTRNISSNLLRIFFKNLIELKFYNKKIDQISKNLKIGFSREEFYEWIEGFGINFKNYIRVCQVTQVVRSDQPSHFRRTFLILLHHYSRECGLLHCLTSKRIERHSIKMHLEGLKNLCKDLGSEFQLQY